MSLINKIKKLFTGNSEDELFVPVEHNEKPKHKKVIQKSSEYVNDLLNEINQTITEQQTTQHQYTTPKPEEIKKEDEFDSPVNCKPHISYSIKLEKGLNVQSHYCQRICVYLTSDKFRNAHTSIKQIEGTTINEMPREFKLIAIERELFDLFNHHAKNYNIEIPSETRIEIINKVKSHFDL